MTALFSKDLSLNSRVAGILLHPTSLPGSHGIGDVGDVAMRFVDFLHDAKHRVWHVLPTGPGVPEESHSPYSTVSAFAHSPLVVSLDRLVDEGLLERKDLTRSLRDTNGSLSADCVDFGSVERFKLPLLRQAALNFQGLAAEAALEAFCQHQPWVVEYAQFAAFRLRFGAEMARWPESVRCHRGDMGGLHDDPEIRQEVRTQIILQYFFAEQWSRLRCYAHQKGVRLYGDLPLYVSGSGADVWAHPELFALDPVTGSAAAVSGVPPDMCNADGQRWGHPLYNWERLKAEGYRWWVERFRVISSFFDVVRIDHVLGLVRYWSIPAKSPTAKEGCWMPGPGFDLFRTVRDELGAISAYVEDLGASDHDVGELRSTFGLMGMRILQYAFEGSDFDLYEGDHSPMRIPVEVVVCTGNHDNAPIAGWFEGLSEQHKSRVREFLGGCSLSELPGQFLRFVMSSPARLCLVQMQDVLGLGNEARMNRPGIVHKSNWSWRLREIPFAHASRLARLAEECNRTGSSSTF